MGIQFLFTLEKSWKIGSTISGQDAIDPLASKQREWLLLCPKEKKTPNPIM